MTEQQEPTTTRALTVKEQSGNLEQFLLRRKANIEAAMSAMAVKYMNPDDLVRLLKVALMRTPKLLECTPFSVLNALMEAGESGLDPSGKGGLGFLVPLKIKGTMTCCFWPGYKGLQLNLLRSKAVEAVDAGVVLKGDDVDYSLGSAPFINHTPSEAGLRSPTEQWEAIRFAYAWARLPGGHLKVVIVQKGDLERIKATSKASGPETPWQAWPIRQCRKTAIKRLANELPLEPGSAIVTAVEADTRTELGAFRGDLSVDETVIDLGVAREPDRGERLAEELRGEDKGKDEGEAARMAAAAEARPAPVRKPAASNLRGQLQRECQQHGWSTPCTKAVLSLWDGQHLAAPTTACLCEFIEANPPSLVLGIESWGQHVYDEIKAALGVAYDPDVAAATAAQARAQQEPPPAVVAAAPPEKEGPTLRPRCLVPVFDRVPPLMLNDLPVYYLAYDGIHTEPEEQIVWDLSRQQYRCTCANWSPIDACVHTKKLRPPIGPAPVEEKPEPEPPPLQAAPEGLDFGVQVTATPVHINDENWQVAIVHSSAGLPLGAIYEDRSNGTVQCYCGEADCAHVERYFRILDEKEGSV